MLVVVSFLRFLKASALAVVRGNRSYYLWLLFLAGWIALGGIAYVHQLRVGLVATNMVDQVPWGAYIANFTYLVGMAAAAVMLVIPAYVYDDHAVHDVVVLGELMAVAVLVMCLSFVMVDIGRPDRFWHLMQVRERAQRDPSGEEEQPHVVAAVAAGHGEGRGFHEPEEGDDHRRAPGQAKK